MSTMKEDLTETRSEGMKSTPDVDATTTLSGTFHVRNVKLRIDTNKGMLWDSIVDFEATSVDDIYSKFTELYLKGILDTRKSQPPEYKKGGMKS